MASNTSDLIVQIKADATSFNSQINQATNKAKTFATSTTTSIAKVGTALIALGGLAAFYLLAKNIAETTDSIGKLNDEADKLGISVEKLQSLSYAADKAGVSAGSLQNAFAVMQRNIGKALDGTKSQVEAFNALGLSAKNLSSLSIDEQFKKIAAALKEVDNASVRAKISQDIFGRGGKELGGLIKSDIESLTASYEKLGIVLSKQQTEAVDEMGESFQLLGKIVEGFFGQVVAEAAPAMTEMVKSLQDTIVAMGGVKNIAKSVADAIVAAANTMRNAFDGVHDSVVGILETIDAIKLSNINRRIDDLESENNSMFTFEWKKKENDTVLKQLYSERYTTENRLDTSRGIAGYDPNDLGTNRKAAAPILDKLVSVLPAISEAFDKNAIDMQANAATKAADSLNKLAESAITSANAVGKDAISRGLSSEQGLGNQIYRIVNGVDKKDVAINTDFDERATKLVSQINSGTISGSEVDSTLKTLSDIAKGEGTTNFGSDAKDNTAMLYAVGELRKYAKERVGEQPVEVNVKIEADAEGIFRAVVSTNGFKEKTAEMVKNVAALEARKNTN